MLVRRLSHVTWFSFFLWNILGSSFIRKVQTGTNKLRATSLSPSLPPTENTHFEEQDQRPTWISVSTSLCRVCVPTTGHFHVADLEGGHQKGGSPETEHCSPSDTSGHLHSTKPRRVPAVGRQLWPRSPRSSSLFPFISDNALELERLVVFSFASFT